MSVVQCHGFKVIYIYWQCPNIYLQPWQPPWIPDPIAYWICLLLYLIYCLKSTWLNLNSHFPFLLYFNLIFNLPPPYSLKNIPFFYCSCQINTLGSSLILSFSNTSCLMQIFLALTLKCVPNVSSSKKPYTEEPLREQNLNCRKTRTSGSKERDSWYKQWGKRAKRLLKKIWSFSLNTAEIKERELYEAGKSNILTHPSPLKV